MHGFLSEHRIIYHAGDWRPENKMFASDKQKKEEKLNKAPCEWNGREMRMKTGEKKISSRTEAESCGAENDVDDGD